MFPLLLLAFGVLAGVTTVGGLAALVDRSISAADAIGKTADRIGVGVEAPEPESAALLETRKKSFAKPQKNYYADPPQIERGEHGEPVAVRVSALTGEGLELLRQAIVERLHGFNNDHNIEDRDRYGTE